MVNVTINIVIQFVNATASNVFIHAYLINMGKLNMDKLIISYIAHLFTPMIS